MQWTFWLSITLWGLVVFGALVASLPLRIEMTVRGKGEWGQMWVVAAGVQVWAMTISFAAASEVQSVLQVHVFGRRVYRRSPVRFPKKSKPAKPKEKLSWSERKQQLIDYRARIERWISLDDLLTLALDLRAFVRFPRFEGHVGYATPDYATTGMLLGGLYAVAGLFVPLGDLHIDPIWEERASIHGDLKLELQLWPVRAVWHVLVFAAKNVNFRRPKTTQQLVSP